MEKYEDLPMDLEAEGRIDLFPIEVGARGIVGRSTYVFLPKIGLSSQERTKASTRMQKRPHSGSGK